MRTLLQDVRYGTRMLRKNPGFSLVIAVALVLTIVAVAATLAPARRATRIDPLAALRTE